MTQTMTTPDRSLAQRRDALANANVIRLQRAQLKRDVKSGRASVADVIASPPSWALKMTADELLRSMPARGAVKVGAMLQAAGVSPRKTLGGMTSRQRVALVAQVTQPFPKPPPFVVVRNNVFREVSAALGPVTSKGVAERLELTARSAAYHLNRLVELGELESARVAGTVFYTVRKED